jgi:hypothetical protein
MAQSDADPARKPDTGSLRGRSSDILLPRRGNPFNPEARPTDLIPDYPGGPGREHPGLEPVDTVVESAAPFAGQVDPNPMPPITAPAAGASDPLPAGDPDPAPGLPAWTDAGVPETPGTGPHTPPPVGHGTSAPVADGSDESESGLGRLSEPEIVVVRDLAANQSLLKLLVSDEDLQRVWREIGQLEAMVTTHSHLSLMVGRELLDRLRSARNSLLHSISNYEEAQRDIAEVRFRLARWARLQFYEQPRFLAVYLVAWLLVAPLIVWVPMVVPDVFVQVEAQAQALEPMGGLSTTVLWWSISSGLIGGVVGAMFNLFRHASRNKDYDPDHAYWFLLAPIMGMILSVGVFLVGRSGLVFGRQDFDGGIYAIAFLLGFQQNLALRYFYRVFRRILPPDEASVRVTAE